MSAGSHPGPFDTARRAPVVRWDPPADDQWAVTPQPGPASSERTTAKIVATLTVACTLLSLYDLYLFTAGV